MYFSSEAGKGFIISDDEEVTGVISVKNPTKKKTKKRHPSFRDRITDTITDTLKRTGKKKRSKKIDIPNFLFVNKPYFSSEDSLEEACYQSSQATDMSQYKQEYPRKSDAKDASKQYRSELLLKIPSRQQINTSSTSNLDNSFTVEVPLDSR